MGGRGAVRSSARLSAETTQAPSTSSTPGARVRPVAAAAAAAARRARAAERAREVEDSPRVLKEKCRRLARALRNAKHLVVYTGAGISTAADIPDYRGPHGVWTRLQRGESVGRVEVSRANPTFTHMALTALWARGALKFVVSQNCDGLHLRAGLPRRALAELHGNMFAELCGSCRKLYLRSFDTTERTARHRHGTKRLCHACGTELRDSIVHFGERGRAAWPLNWAGALRHAARADVVLCLGSSLKVLRRYGRLWRMHSAPSARPALFIVNLQWTPKDAVAKLKINARCDTVMRQVARRLRLRVPRYDTPRDPVIWHSEPLAPPETHTTRRSPLRDAAPSPHLSYHTDDSSPSASDSDEEVPLRRLADRLKPPTLKAFKVNLMSGEATILLRSEHAPSPHSSPSRSPSRPATSELRRFRIRRRHTPPPTETSPPHTPEIHPRLNGIDIKPEIKKEEMPNGTLGSRLRKLLEQDPLPIVKKEEEDIKKEPPDTKLNIENDDKNGSLAAAIIARAVLLCRASLYSGFHTIISQPSPTPTPTPKPAECSWCDKHFGSRRCLWYGPPRDTPLTSRVWRKIKGRKYLCACCGDGEEGTTNGEETGGWYGKGYRKGRRKKR